MKKDKTQSTKQNATHTHATAGGGRGVACSGGASKSPAGWSRRLSEDAMQSRVAETNL